MAVTEPAGDLRRVIGFSSGTALIVGITIGSGIFRTPPTIAGLVPSPLVIMALWVAFGLISICGALTVAELSSMLPRTRRGVRVSARGVRRRRGVRIRLDLRARHDAGERWLRWPRCLRNSCSTCFDVPADACHRAGDRNRRHRHAHLRQRARRSRRSGGQRSDHPRQSHGARRDHSRSVPAGAGQRSEFCCRADP